MGYRTKGVQPVKESFQIAIIYGVIGSLWISSSDHVLGLIIEDYDQYQILQTYKGWFYVLTTMVLFYILILKRLKLYQYTLMNLNDSYTKLSKVDTELRTNMETLREKQAQLLMSQQRYELAVDGVNDAIWEWDLEKDIYYLSPKWQEKIMGNEKSELSFKDWQTFIHPDDQQRLNDYVEDFIKKGNRQYQNIFRIVCQDKRVLWLYSNGKTILNEKGQVIRMAGSHTDMTNQLKLQEENKKSHDLIKKVFNNTSNYIVIWNNLGKIVEINPQVEKSFNEQNIIGKDYFDVFIPHITIEERKIIINDTLKKDGYVMKGQFINNSSEDVFILWTNNLLYQDTESEFNIISIGTDVTELTTIKKELNDLVYFDKLTGLPNRYMFENEISDLIGKDEPFALICIDIDNIKHINDTLGHSAGDVLIQSIGKSLKNSVLEPHLVSRFGGDEFLIVLKDLNNETTLVNQVNDIYSNFKKLWIYNNQQYFITASIGIAIYPHHGFDFDTLFKNADTAMYSAKESGKDKVHLFRYEMNQINNYLIQTVNDLKKAIERKDFVIY